MAFYIFIAAITLIPLILILINHKKYEEIFERGIESDTDDQNYFWSDWLDNFNSHLF